MNVPKIIPVLFFLIILTAATSYTLQQFTQIVTAQNKGCNATCSNIDIPELNNNPAAIIFVTPIVDGGTSATITTLGSITTVATTLGICGDAINEQRSNR